MPDVLTVQVHGLAELEKKMISLGPRLARSALRGALAAGAQVIKKETQLRAPVLTGRLSKRAIYVYRAKDAATDSQETYIVGVRHGRKEKQRDKEGIKKEGLNFKTRDAFYWKFLEFGTKFIAATPFLRPAFEAKKQEAVNVIKQKLLERIEALTR